MSLDFSHYDARHYPTLDVLQGYERWVPLYESTVDGQLDLPLIDGLVALDWARIRAVADLACGTGRVGAWLKSSKKFEQIDGVDCSPHMLAKAKEKSVYRRLVESDVGRTTLDAAGYDLALSILAACHLPDLNVLYREAARITKSGGHFVLVDFHPFFFVRGIPTHFETQSGETFAIRNTVHHFSDHVAAGRAAGFQLQEMKERLIDEAWVQRVPKLKSYLHQPVGFAMVWVR